MARILGLDGQPITSEALAEPHFSYIPQVRTIRQAVKIKGLAHITGGGFIENIPRILPDGVGAIIKEGSWPVKPIFQLISRWGDIGKLDMFNTFNMGIGMVVVCQTLDADGLIRLFSDQGYPAHIIGRIEKGREGVVFS